MRTAGDTIHPTAQVNGDVRLGRGSAVDAYATLGGGPIPHEPTALGPGAHIRNYSVVNGGVRAGRQPEPLRGPNRTCRKPRGR